MNIHENTLFNEKVTITLQNTIVELDVDIRSSWTTVISFSLFNSTYTFDVDKWGGRELTRFLILFHEHCARDKNLFGHVSSDGQLLIDLNQKKKCVIQACRDVFSCIDKILELHGRGILDYAVYHCEHFRAEDTYREYIMIAACHCIVHCNFIAPNVTWQKVSF